MITTPKTRFLATVVAVALAALLCSTALAWPATTPAAVSGPARPAGPAVPAVDPGLARAAVLQVAQAQGIDPAQLETLNAVPAGFGLSKAQATLAKVVDKTTGRTYQAALAPDGRPIGPAELADMRRAEDALAATQGKVEPALKDRLAKAAPGELVRVGLWLVAPDTSAVERAVQARFAGLPLMANRPDPKADAAQAKAYRDELRKARAPVYQAHTRGVEQAATALGGRVVYSCRYAPLVYVEVPAVAVAALENRPDVVTMYLSRDYEPEIDSAVPTVWPGAFWANGYFGAGVDVAVNEAGRIDFANPWLGAGVTRDPNGYIDAHPTEIGGIIRSSEPVFQGMGHSIRLLSANSVTWNDADLTAAAEWALGQGADVLSCSYGFDTALAPGPLDRFYDHVIWEHLALMCKSAGNNGAGNGNITSPGLGWNMLTVGGVYDNNTVAWVDDSRYAASSYRDPISPHSDRHKPEISAVAQGMRSTEPQTYFNLWGVWITRAADPHSGTSYAAPMVAGEIGLMISFRNWLRSWPEVVRSVVMASASRMVYGVIAGGNTPDDKEGCGTIVTDYAYWDLARGFTAALYATAPADFPKNVTIPAVVGEKIRVVLNWDSHTNWHADPNMDTLTADLDLVIYDPSGNFVNYSASWDNNYEMVEFTAQANGNYTARITAFRFDAGLEYMGVAWHK